ncbi:hypothetical protein ACH5RR_037277 [Cinchona calisaya]|uniref:Retrotransposon gag protein n=1 Tax=Cinchona calisaya TaxID=153742 RepID=A0ABD2Y5Q9_9GENT
MLDYLLKKKVIELPQSKHLEDIRREHLRYCKYHCRIDHPLEKWFILKDLILNLIEKGTIIFDEEGNVESNHVAISRGHLSQPLALTSCLFSSKKPGASLKTIQFGSFAPMPFAAQSQHSQLQYETS